MTAGTIKASRPSVILRVPKNHEAAFGAHNAPPANITAMEMTSARRGRMSLTINLRMSPAKRELTIRRPQKQWKLSMNPGTESFTKYLLTFFTKRRLIEE